jgi:hypothetical protein
VLRRLSAAGTVGEQRTLSQLGGYLSPAVLAGLTRLAHTQSCRCLRIAPRAAEARLTVTGRNVVTASGLGSHLAVLRESALRLARAQEPGEPESVDQR